MSINENNEKYSKYHILKTIIIALFSALSYLALVVFRIPYPAPVGKPFLHFGNMIVILAALLIGGWRGGLSGSIGMGLYDMTNGYLVYSIKTIVLKFGIGIFTGIVAHRGIKNPEKSPKKALAISTAISFMLGGLILIGKLFSWGEFHKISSVSYIFLLSLGVILLGLTLLCSKISNEILFAALGGVAGIAWNVVGEFAGGTIMKMIEGATWQTSMIASLLSLPATLINGVFSIVGAMLLYVPLKSALKRTHLDHALVK